MKLKYIFCFLSLLAILSGACTRLKTPEAVAERERWFESFHDSISYYQKRSQEIHSELSACNDRISSTLQNFEHINNPRHVTGYYILKGWNARIPFTSTAIYARINEDEKIEVIATLAGATFNKITVSSDGKSVFSGVVPYDQALNYRHATYNTVCFSDSTSDLVAKFIAENQNAKIDLTFFEGGKKSNFVIPADEKSMIARTWNLHDEQLRQKELQKDLWLTSRKIDACRRMLESVDSLNKK